MIVYYFIVGIILFNQFLMYGKKVISKKIYCTMLGFCLFLVASLRKYTVGNDSSSYMYAFYRADSTSWENIKFVGKDPFFSYFMKIIGIFTNDHQIFFGVVAAIFSISISVFIYKYSEYPGISYLVLLSFEFFQFSMTGLRQILAISILLFSFPYLKNGKIIKYILLVGFSSLFHITALIFTILYPLRKLKFSFFSGIIFLLLFLSTKVIGQPLVYYLASFLSERGYENLNTGILNTLILNIEYCALLILFLIFKKSYYLKDNQSELYIYIFCVGIFFQFLGPYEANIFRIAMYFSIILTILIPNTLSAIKDRHIKVYGIIAIYFILIIQYIVFSIDSAGVGNYLFFWQ
jgi:hypothetical protein